MRLAHVGPLSVLLFAAVVLTHRAHAQSFDNRWVEFQPAADAGDVGDVSANDTEVDFAWGDFDGDGWIDVAAVRKEPYTQTGKRENRLFMNEFGVLRDRTAQFAVASDVPGDQGFATPTNDRDISVADFDLDGLLDLVTATTLSDGDPKHIGHPRLYMNQGSTGGGWSGFRFEDARIPQLFSATSGLPRNPRFMGVATGDVTADGYPDAYFVDHDASGAGGAGQPNGFDLNDRLLVNDGAGFFADESAVRMTTTMLRSAFGVACEIADMNGDGANDVIKNTALTVPQYIGVIYNDPAAPGDFAGLYDFHDYAPYGMDVADLNNDGRLDLIATSEFEDRWRINLGNGALGNVLWSEAFPYAFLKGADDGFGSNALAVDLDGDGWLDALHCDIDNDIPNAVFDSRYLHVYHNVLSDPSGPGFVEERAQPDAGWRGAFGIAQDDLQRTFDVAVFDLDRDGDNDMLLGREAGGSVWINQANPVFCQANLGFAGPGSTVFEVCGQPLFAGLTARLSVVSSTPAAPGFLAVGQLFNPTPLFGGTVVPFPVATLAPFVTDSAGAWALDYTVATRATATLYLQVAILDPVLPGLVSLSNAVRAEVN